MICVNDKGEYCKYSHDGKIDGKIKIYCLACCRMYGYNSREEAEEMDYPKADLFELAESEDKD